MTFTLNPCPCILYKHNAALSNRLIRVPPYAKTVGFTMNIYYINSSGLLNLLDALTLTVTSNNTASLEVLDTKDWNGNGFPLLNGKTLMDEETKMTLNIVTRAELKNGSIIAITVDSTKYSYIDLDSITMSTLNTFETSGGVDTGNSKIVGVIIITDSATLASGSNLSITGVKIKLKVASDDYYPVNVRAFYDLDTFKAYLADTAVD